MMTEHRSYRGKTLARVIGVLGVASLMASAGFAQARGVGGSADPVTFAKDVAPILEEKCQVCHRPGAMGPMPLVTYDEVRPWVRSIRARVAGREMPPWHLDKTVGIQTYKNDRSLTDEQLNTILAWIDAGAPLGDVKDMPAQRQWPTADEWQMAAQFGQPDLIVRTPPWTMASHAPDAWLVPVVDTGLTEDRWVRAIETRPSIKGRRIVHHADTFLIQDDEPGTSFFGKPENIPAGGLHLSEWAVNKNGEMFRENTGKLMKAGSRIRFDLHYHAIGEEITDQIEVAFYFYPKGIVPKYRVYMGAFGPNTGERQLDIPPGKVVVSHGYYPLRAPARLENFQPHMHMRGKAATLEAIYPDGRTEILSHIDRFDFNWHVNYIYADDSAPVLPRGTVIHVVAVHDNTAGNKNNPDPTQWVGFGARSTDEMFHHWINVTFLTDEDYAAIVQQRQKAAATRAGAQQ
jgi:hypothetical protein